MDLPTGENVLLSLEFTGIKNGTSALTLVPGTFQLLDSNGIEITATWYSGNLTVS